MHMILKRLALSSQHRFKKAYRIVDTLTFFPSSKSQKPDIRTQV